MSVYALSFFKSPSCIISSIKSIFNIKNLGECEDHRNKEFGSLRVRRMKDFIIVALGKWCWRLLVDRDELWFKVLASCMVWREGD